MKAIVAMNKDELKHYDTITMNLYDKLGKEAFSDHTAFEEIHKKPGYAHYTFKGKLSPTVAKKLGRMPTPDEVIILVDSGYSHFGASCSLSPDGTFSGRVCTD